MPEVWSFGDDDHQDEAAWVTVPHPSIGFSEHDGAEMSTVKKKDVLVVKKVLMPLPTDNCRVHDVKCTIRWLNHRKSFSRPGSPSSNHFYLS